MALKFTTTNEVSTGNGIKILVYGRSGMGKTMLCATMPDACILSAENGLLSLSEANQLRVFKKSVDIPVIHVTCLKDLEDAYEFLTENEHGKLLNPCLDSVTEIAEQVLINELKKCSDPRQAYGELHSKMMVILRDFRDMPGRHVLFIAQEEARAQNEATLFGPAMPGKKLGQKSPYVFDEVFHMGIGKTPEGVEYRFLQTTPDVQYDAKDRSGCLDAVEEPNLSNVIAKITHK